MREGARHHIRTLDESAFPRTWRIAVRCRILPNNGMQLPALLDAYDAEGFRYLFERLKIKNRTPRIVSKAHYMIMKEWNKYVVLLPVICMALISFGLICYAQEQNIEKDYTRKFSFDGSWDEGKAIEITKNICKKWVSIERIEDCSIKTSLFYKKNGIQKRFVQILMPGESCHFCSGLIGAVIFSETNGGWEVEFEDKTFANYGSNGIPPEAKLVKIGYDRFALLYQWFRMMQTGHGRTVEDKNGEGYVILSGGYVHYVAIIDLGDKKYPLILEDETYQKEEDFKNQPPVIPKVEVISTTNDNLYNIRINNKIYKYQEGKYKELNK